MIKKIIMSLLLTLVIFTTGSVELDKQADTISNNSVNDEIQVENDMQIIAINTVEMEDNHLVIFADNLQTSLFNLDNITTGEKNLIYLFKDSEQKTVIDHVELTANVMQELNIDR